MVFEGWVVDHLSSWLGHFLDLQRDQLRISLWRGALRWLVWESIRNYYSAAFMWSMHLWEGPVDGQSDGWLGQRYRRPS